MRPGSTSRIRRRFQRLSRARGRVPHALRTLSPLPGQARGVRLACLIHAASVHSEPGSNSPLSKSRPDDSGSTSSLAPADQRPRGSLGAGLLKEARLPHVALRCSVSKEASARKTGVPHNMARENGIASPKCEYFGKKTEKGSGKPSGSPHKTIYRIERRRRIRSSRGGWVANSVPKLGKLIYIEAKALPPNSWTSLRVIPFSQF